jgi:TPR repeat protein
MHSISRSYKRPAAKQRGFLDLSRAERLEPGTPSARSGLRFAFYVGALLAAGLLALAMVPHHSTDAADRAQLTQQAAAGSPHAELLLGLAYRDGRYGLKKDAGAAARWLDRAAQAGDAYASALLGDAYAKGTGVAKDEGTAEHWWRLAADAGNAHGATQLGLALDARAVTASDHDQAHAWLERGAALGDATARQALGIDVAPPADQFRGDSHSITAGIGELLQSADPAAQSLASLRQRAVNGDSVAQYQLAMRYRDGSWGVDANPELALRWLEQAAKLGNPVAMESLATAYRDGKLGLNQNERLAAQWQQRADQARTAKATTAPR